ncbi:MAG: Ribosomal RNA small subunit methyltransferase A [candidate division WS2 bacterium]|uniref:Ribosomal RNA small subunit methyltransferase A n=1 Tax=Psychracetigena formicireducens TaxID=2986056 RepID=A0A9E2BHD5_PSYF1|nr:Ribosomal RNA small subunit methyltransferase A [Candidatus Psychracetigena formicireducens]MBT9145606.1 Ribosomal RNA small subunit methyltransferase A [Candidatus Psychracetigena formicireducens]
MTDRDRVLTESLVDYNSVVMEVGSGNGFLTEHLAQKVRLVYAIELQKGMVVQLEKRVKRWKNKVKIFNQDIADYHHKDAPVDTVIAFYSFHEIKNQEKAVINMVNSLKKDGYICLYEPTLEVNWKKMEKTANLFSKSGIDIDFYRKGRFTNFLRLKKV